MILIPERKVMPILLNHVESTCALIEISRLFKKLVDRCKNQSTDAEIGQPLEPGLSGEQVDKSQSTVKDFWSSNKEFRSIGKASWSTDNASWSRLLGRPIRLLGRPIRLLSRPLSTVGQPL